MAQRHVLFTLNHAPFGSIFYTEGLRAAVGVTSGIDEHTVDVVYVGDGVYFTLNGVDRSDTAKYLGTLANLGYKLRAERESLAERGIAADRVAPDVALISRQELVDLINRADMTIDL